LWRRRASHLLLSHVEVGQHKCEERDASMLLAHQSEMIKVLSQSLQLIISTS